MTVTSPMESLEGKVALVTGASRRIGRSTALGLARHGADLVITARSAKRRDRSRGRRDPGAWPGGDVVMGDVTDEADVARMVAGGENGSWPNRHPGQQCRHPSAGALPGDDPCRMARNQRRHPGRRLLDEPRGSAGDAGQRRRHDRQYRRHDRPYRRRKRALMSAPPKRASSASPRRSPSSSRIRASPRIASCPARLAASGRRPRAPHRMSVLAIPLGREGDIEEAAGMIVSMCLPHARFMTGQSVHISGGLYMP